jgi:L,D-peptidoglycan transpeptidase YkuD (ErfK/YbiS/YcfS/YnhG family)
MVGRSGILSSKREGDGGTPAGIFSLREVRYRADRLAAPPVTGLPLITTLARDGWCDDPADSNYNRCVTLPYMASAEVLWRADHLYDVLAVIGYNDAPPVPGAGSAIFLHVMRQQAGVGLPTAGCVSLARADLLTVLARCGAQSTIHIRTV